MQNVKLNDGNKIPAVGFGVFLIENYEVAAIYSSESILT